VNGIDPLAFGTLSGYNTPEGDEAMGFLKRLAFYLGLVLGMASVAAAGAVALTYLFTGKFPILNINKQGTEVKLMLPDEVSVLIREQMAKGRGAAPSIELS
jgi:hypothetical protein